ncbi:22131_t:CDS:2, partial [Cetraspora pellucida]
MEIDPILNEDTAPSVEDESHSINISACEGPNSSIEEVITDNHKQPKKQKLERRSGSKKRSWVWRHFDSIIVTDKDGKETHYGECQIIKDNIRCTQKIKIVGGTTSNLIHHLSSVHVNDNKTHPKARNDFLIRSLLKFIIRENMPLNLVSKESFQEFVHNLDSAFIMPCEKTVKQLIHVTYNYSTNLLKQRLELTSKTVCLTIDLWTARNRQGFLGITCSWIDESFKMQEALLTLSYLKYPHTS